MAVVDDYDHRAVAPSVAPMDVAFGMTKRAIIKILFFFGLKK